MKSQVLHIMWCNIPREAAGEIWNLSLLGVKRVKLYEHSRPFISEAPLPGSRTRDANNLERGFQPSTNYPRQLDKLG